MIRPAETRSPLRGPDCFDGIPQRRRATCAMTLVVACVSVLTAAWRLEARAESKDEPPPDLELIEFLGSFTTKDGELVDPTGWIADDEYLAVAAPKQRSKEEELERSN